jgi:hypothetical protein
MEIAAAADPWVPFITEASRRFGVPEQWIGAIMSAESADDARALSPKGAMGLMQVMPETWADLRARHSLGADPYDPRDNILAGVAYIRELYDRYGVPGFLAAYNAGPGRYDDYLATGRPLPPETRTFVAMLKPMIVGGQVEDGIITAADPLGWTHAPLFIVRATSKPAYDRPSNGAQPTRSPTDHAVVDFSALAPNSDGLFVRPANAALRQ